MGGVGQKDSKRRISQQLLGVLLSHNLDSPTDFASSESRPFFRGGHRSISQRQLNSGGLCGSSELPLAAEKYPAVFSVQMKPRMWDMVHTRVLWGQTMWSGGDTVPAPSAEITPPHRVTAAEVPPLSAPVCNAVSPPQSNAAIALPQSSSCNSHEENIQIPRYN